MRVLIVHNRYQQRGGEDAVVEAEAEILSARGVEVEVLLTDNEHIRGLTGKLRAAGAAAYSRRGVAYIESAIGRFSPDVVHVHNWFPTLSPAVFGACTRSQVPVVHTLHNYRLLCAKASLSREGEPCEECMGTVLRLPGIMHGCYRNSRIGSAAVTVAMLLHWQLGTWENSVTRYIALSGFAKEKLVQGGLPAAKIAVKPNALASDPGVGGGDGGYLAYVGRLTDEKGIPTLLDCWRRDASLPNLYIVGGGPLEGDVRAASVERKNIVWLGRRRSAEVQKIMRNATALICPSTWYEGMPRVAIEAMAVGTPVIASRLGTYIEMIQHEKSGLLFEAGDAASMLNCIKRAEAENMLKPMRQSARHQFESKYSAETSFRSLLGIYQEALSERNRLAAAQGRRSCVA